MKEKQIIPLPIAPTELKEMIKLMPCYVKRKQFNLFGNFVSGIPGRCKRQRNKIKYYHGYRNNKATIAELS